MRGFFLLACMWLSFSSFVEDPIKLSIKDILTSVHKERRVTNSTQTLDYIQSLNFKIPLVKSVGLKYGTDDLTNAKRQYSASFGLNSLRLMKEQSALKNAQFGVYQAKKDQLLTQVIHERYLYIVDAYFTQSILANQKALDTLLNQKNLVLKTSLQKGIPIKVKDLVETEDDQRSLTISISEISNLNAQSHQRIKDYMGFQGSFILFLDNFVSVKKIEELINNFKTNRTLQSPELKVSQSRMNLTQSEMRVEEAAFKQIFDGFQLIYEHKGKTDFTTQDFSFRLGFNIPIKGNFRPKRNELLLDMKDMENEYQTIFLETDRQVKTQILKIENLIQQYKMSSESLSNSLSINLLNTPSVLATLAPADVVDLKIIQQKKTIEIQKIYYELAKEYIELLDLTGNLALSPYKNYLSNNFELW